MTAWDEMVDGRGGVRPHWRPVLGALSGFDRPGLAARALRLERAAEEEGSAAAWRCDPVPLPLTAAEFATLESGLCQRATLMEAILADIYGPQTMLAQGALPPALVFANPGFLRACRTGQPQRSPFLQTYAADLIRSPDGQWRVLADRTGGALGIGYARETRRLLARVLPELFRTNQVRQLRPFFEAWQDALIRAAPPVADRAPAVALLTPGVEDPHWPEHLALSRNLACALVQAQDLTVRAGNLYLKTLQGLQQVDLLLRRVPGGALDPLEVPGSASSGVTGLFEAARLDTVRILNHPGAALVEAPALSAFMPCLCRRLLGERLRLATLPSVWLADEGMQRTVAQGFQRWGIRSAVDAEMPLVRLPNLARQDRMELERAIAAAPWSFAGCTLVPPSLAPCHGDDGLTAQPVVLRLFLMHDGAGWRMMPGGVAWVLPPGAHPGEALPADAVFKDVWVLSQENADIVGPEPGLQRRVPLRRDSGDMPSRVADDFFWLGRYIERLESQARLGRAALLRLARGAPLPREASELEVLGDCLAAAGLLEADEGLKLDIALRRSLQAGGAARLGLDHVARLTASLRDRLTVETHSAFVHAIKAAQTDVRDGLQLGVDGLVHAMTGLQRLATTVAGVAADGMVQGGGRLFLDLGRRLERAMVTAWSIATVLDQPLSRMDAALRLALALCDSAITYRSRYLSTIQPGPVLDLVLADTGNPRALNYQFSQAAALLEAAGDHGLAWVAHELQEKVAALVDRVVEAGDPIVEAASLAQALFRVAAETAALSDRITRRFFALLPAFQAVGLEVA